VSRTRHQRDPAPSPPPPTRRDLLTLGFAPARRRADPHAGGEPHERSAPDWAEFHRVDDRVRPAAEALVRSGDVRPGQRVLDIGAGDGAATAAAAAAGADVETVAMADAAALPHDAGAFDRVVSAFGVIHAPDSRRAVAEIDRVLRPGGVVAVTAWASRGLMGGVLRLAAAGRGRTTRSARPERWGRFEGIQLAFSRFPGFEVHDHVLRWVFASPEAAWEALAAPPGPLAGAAEPYRAAREPLRRRTHELLARSARREADGLTVDVAYVLVVARKPDWAISPAPAAG
jgi:SAM-dependent methyltransferase